MFQPVLSSSPQRQRHVIIIGAGVSGLATSIRLAHLGLSVTLLEKNAAVGGKLNEYSEKGYRFDIGPSLFTLPHLVDELFTLCGENPREHFRYFELEDICHYFFPDGKAVVSCRDRPTLSFRLEESLGEAACNTRAFLEHSERLWRLTSGLFIFGNFRQWPTLVQEVGKINPAYLTKAGFFSTLNRVTTRFFKTPQARQLFNRYATYNGSDPYRAPGTLAVIPHAEYGFGAWLPEGGIAAIPRSLEALALRQSVRILRNTPALKVEQASRKWLVTTPAGVLEADFLICAVDVATFFTRLFPQQSIARRILRSERSTSAFVFNWGIRRTHDLLGVHNIFFSENYPKEFASLRMGNMPEDPTIYVFISSKRLSQDAPPGYENWFVMVNAPASYPTTPETFEKVKTTILSKLKNRWRLDIQPCIEVEYPLGPDTLRGLYGSYDGALYGSASNSPWSAFLRVPNRSRRFPGLFFCGGTVHPGGGIPLCLSSAKLVSDAVARSLA